MYVCLIALLVIAINALPARAIEAVTLTSDTFNSTYIYPNIPDFAPTPDGGLGWEIFQTTTEDFVMGTGDDANVVTEKHPKFSRDLEVLDGKTITMRGYMFPLDDTDAQARFLFGPFPVTCAFHYHTPATLVIEAHTKTPLAFTYDDFVLSGTLHLVRDQKNEPYYRLTDATLAKDQSQSIVHTDRKSMHPIFRGTPMDMRKNPDISADAPTMDDYKAK